uniref:Jacalin-type lectin domain-containing protein n=1 Tax=Oryza barthii TaxID=65489 RepID=A0A0D3FS45_9ORYZ
MGNFSGAEVVMIVAITICLYTFAFVSGIILAWGLDKKPPRASNSALDRRRRLSSINNGNNAEDHHGRQAAAAVVVPRAVSTRPTTMNPISSPSSSTKVSTGESLTTMERRSAAKVGLWGGSGGRPFDIRPSATVPRRLNTITLYHSDGAIHSLYYDYYMKSQRRGGGGDELKLVKDGPWGQRYSYNSIAVHDTIKLSADEQVTSVEGTIGRFRDVDEPVITSLTFRTNAGKAYGPYGGAGDKQEGTHFSIPVDNGGVVVGF